MIRRRHTATNQQSDEGGLASDEALVQRAKLGDDEAFTALCQRHSAMALRVVSRILRVEEDAEDVLQESILLAYVHLKAFNGQSRFSTWFIRISVNSALMFLRKAKYNRIQSLDNSLDSESLQHSSLTESSPGPELTAIQTQLLFQLRQAVEKLPMSLRGIAKIRHSGDYSVQEIAQIAGLSVPATKSRLLRARRRLAKKLHPPSTQSLSVRADQTAVKQSRLA